MLNIFIVIFSLRIEFTINNLFLMVVCFMSSLPMNIGCFYLIT
jgi:hypothetical protein